MDSCSNGRGFPERTTVLEILFYAKVVRLESPLCENRRRQLIGSASMRLDFHSGLCDDPFKASD
jgi:hypothetical protein